MEDPVYFPPDGQPQSRECKDIIEKMMTKDPEDRISMLEIRDHPFYKVETIGNALEREYQMKMKGLDPGSTGGQANKEEPVLKIPIDVEESPKNSDNTPKEKAPASKDLPQKFKADGVRKPVGTNPKRETPYDRKKTDYERYKSPKMARPAMYSKAPTYNSPKVGRSPKNTRAGMKDTIVDDGRPKPVKSPVNVGERMVPARGRTFGADSKAKQKTPK